MKNQLLLMVAITVLSLSCKKESAPEPVTNVVFRMKSDIEMKELYDASKEWVIMTSIDIGKRRFDSAATVKYLQDFKSTEYGRLLRLAERVKSRYKFDRYSVDDRKSMVLEVFQSYTLEEPSKSTRVTGERMFQDPAQPVDLRFPAYPKDCYKHLVENVSDCDEEMVLESGFALFGLITGPMTYLISQGIAFVRHSRCVDKAHKTYKECQEKTSEPFDSESTQIGEGTFQIRNPDDPGDFIIIHSVP